MATVTPNFNWPVPTSTDLVKDGATAIEALGDSIDASLVDLKGGTTGQVLSKTSGTDMDFTWVTSDDANAIQNTIVDAKGDLIAATAADTPARLAVGTNGQVLTADSTAATGLAWATPSGGSNTFFAGKNKIINGDFNVNQRALTSTTTSGVFGFDRWIYYYTSGTVTYSAQTFTPGAAPVAGYEGKNFARVLSSGQTGTNANTIFRQFIESVRTFAGQTVTVSFWAKAASGTPKIAVELGQSFGTGGSPSGEVNTYAGQVTLSTSWARYSVSVAVPSISGKTIGTNNNDALLLTLWTSAGSDFNARTGSIGIQNNTFDIWGVQMEAGSTATDFVTASGGSIQGELAMCQRYYFRAFSDSGYKTFGVGTVTGVNNMNCFVNLPVQMRTIPTTLDTSAMSTFYWEPGGGTTPTSITLATSATQNLGNVQVSKTSSFTVGYAVGLFSNNTAAYLGFSAEL